MKFTNSEEQVMKYLWKLKRAFFKDLMNEFPDPKPATTTLNTLIKRIIDKGGVDFKVYGNSREYYALIEKDQYFSGHVKSLIKDFFNDSSGQFASFFTKQIDMSDEELKELRDLVDDQLSKKNE